MLPLPTPAANKEAKRTQCQGSTQLIPAASSTSFLQPWQQELAGPYTHRVLGTLHPSRCIITAPQYPEFQPFFFWQHQFSPNSLPPARGKGQICQLVCGEFSFFRTKSRRHRSSHIAVSSPFPHPKAHAIGSSTDVLQHQNRTELLPPVPQKSFDLPTNPLPRPSKPAAHFGQ